MAALLLGAVLPGWYFWQAVERCWGCLRLDLRLALGIVGGLAVTPLVLYWACRGHDFSRTRCGYALLVACFCLGAVGEVARRRRERRQQLSTLPAPVPLGVRLGLAALVLTVCGLSLLPWSTTGRAADGMVSLSPCSGDWSCHRNFTVAILATGIPPRNPFLGYKGLSYYYGHFIEAAALIRLSGERLTVEAALVVLLLLLGAATCVLLFHLCHELVGSAQAALAATALTTLVAGADLVVLYALGLVLGPPWWESGHLASWARDPRVFAPLSNLHWAAHHHGAALLVLCLIWYLHRRGEHLGWHHALAAGVLAGGLVVNSAYLGTVGLLALVVLAVVRLRRRAAHGLAGSAYAARLALALLVALVLTNGMLREMGRMVPNAKVGFAPGAPRIPQAPELLVLALNHVPVQRNVELVAPEALLGTVLADLPAQHKPLRHLWLTREPGRYALEVAAGLVALPFQFGLVGVLGVAGMLQRNGPSTPAPIWALLCAAAVAAFFVSNFDLQARSAALLWLLLGVWVARRLACGATILPRSVGGALVAALLVLGVAGLGYELGGVSRPVWFEAQDLRLMQWIRDHTPPEAVVQAYPSTQPRVAWLPQQRYWGVASYPELTGRVALLGDADHIWYYERPEVVGEVAGRLAAAFAAHSAREAHRRFREAGVDYVLWTSNEQALLGSTARRRLSDPRYFEVVHREGLAFVVRVLPVPAR